MTTLRPNSAQPATLGLRIDLRFGSRIAFTFAAVTTVAAGIALYFAHPTTLAQVGGGPLWLTAALLAPCAGYTVSLICWTLARDLTRRAEAAAAAEIALYIAGDSWHLDEATGTLTPMAGGVSDAG